MAQLGPVRTVQRQGQRTKNGGHGGHEDGAQAQAAGAVDGLGRGGVAIALPRQGEVDHHDRVLLDDADQQDDANQRDERELRLEPHQRQQRPHSGGGQRGEDGDGVHQVFIQDAQHQVDGDDGRQDEQRLPRQGGLERPRRAAEAAPNAHGHAQLGHSVVHGIGRLRQRHARRQAEADGAGRRAALVVDGQRRVGGGDACKRGERHLLAHVVHKEEAAQRLGALQVLRRGLHHHAVLVEGVVDDAHLPLPKGVIQRGVDLRHGEAQARGGVAVNHQRGLQAVVGHVAVHVFQLRQLRQRLADARLPGAQLGNVVGLQRVVKRGTALPPANADVTLRRHEQARAGLVLELLAQPGDHHLRRLLPRPALERHEHRRRVALPATRGAGDIFHRRVGLHDGQKALQPLLHGLV